MPLRSRSHPVQVPPGLAPRAGADLHTGHLGPHPTKPGTGVPDDPIWVAAETGHGYDRRGHGADTQSALTDAGVNPSEPFRITRIRCRSMARAIELAEEKRTELGWVTGLRLRTTGELAADWHGGSLSPVEQRLLRAQQAEDAAAKRSQRDRAIRDLQREVL